jgi:2-keto-4-pentenoate hydratase/2-oxohepta-3-ene-1,7-dioic acid hydratase in catechol pathway
MSDNHQHLVRCRVDGEAHWGLLDGADVWQLEGSPFSGELTTKKRLGPIEAVQLEAPASPSKIVCVGRNYAAHAAEHQAQVPSEPLLFLKPPSSVIGPEQPIVLPPQSQQVEHEAELALVIGRRCRNLTEDEAWRNVTAVTCGNDVTARDLQRKDNQWTRGKGFDTFCPLGPQLVTGLEEDEVRDLAISCRVGAELRQQASTRDMIFSPAYLISYISKIMTLMPGDVIMTGTPAGVGRLTSGDQVEVEISNIGILRNPIV